MGSGVRGTIEPDDDDFDVVPGSALDDDDQDDEGVGVDDSDALLLSELDDLPEEVGLDTESLGQDPFALLPDLTEDRDESSAYDDAPLEIDAEVDAHGEEHGWLGDAEGKQEAWDESSPELETLDEPLDDDSGEEGVNDPLLDGLPQDQELPRLDEDDDDDELDESSEDVWSDELPLDIRPT